jgi:hypothetical protein
MRYFLFFSLLIISFSSFAQDVISVKGVVKNDNGKTVGNATVSLYYIGHTDTINIAANDKGVFIFRNIKPGKIGIKVTSSGYNSFQNIYDYTGAKDDKEVWDIVMTNKVTTLQEVTIEGMKVQIKEDTVTYKVDSTMYHKNDNVEQVLKKLPGVQVDKNGDVTAQGKAVTKVKVNGKEFFGGDVKTATRELRADMVDNVQVIDDYGDQAAFTGVKDGEPTKTLNIQLKKDKNHGYFGNTTLGGGTDERYLGSVSLHHFNNSEQISLLGNINNTNSNLFNFPTPGKGGVMRMFSNRGGIDQGGASQVGNIVNNGDVGFLQSNSGTNDGISTTKSIGLNYRDDWSKKISVYGSYSYSNRQTDVINNSTTQSVFNDTTNTNIQNSTQNNLTDNHRIYFNVEYKMDSFNYVKFSPSFSYRTNNSTGNSDFGSYNNDVLQSKGTTSAGLSSTAPNFSGTLLFNHRFHKRGRFLSLNFTEGNSSSGESDNNNNPVTYYNNGVPFTRTLDQDIEQENNNHNWGVRVSYNEPLSRKRSFEVNYNYNNSFVGNNKQTSDIDPATGNRKIVDSLTNIYDNSYSTHRIGVNFRTNEKKYNYTFGMAVQPAVINSNSISKQYSYSQSLFNYFPVVRFAYNFSKSRSFSVNYSGSTSQPSYNQLQPVFDYSNPQYPTVGNPNLKPEFNNSISTRYNNFNFIKGNVFFGNLSFSATSNKIVTNTINKGYGIQETHYLNTNGFYSLTGFYLYSKPIQNRKFVFTLNGTALYNNNISYIQPGKDSASEKNIGRNWVVSQRFNTDINIKKWLETSIGVTYAMNSTNYSLNDQLSTTTQGWNITHSARIFIREDFIISYDIDKSFNQGYADNVNSSPLLINATIEKQLFKKKNASIKLQGFDLLNENTNVSRTVTGTAITDSRSNKLGRYYMLSFIFRLNKFKGQAPQADFKRGMRMMGM